MVPFAIVLKTMLKPTATTSLFFFNTKKTKKYPTSLWCVVFFQVIQKIFMTSRYLVTFTKFNVTKKKNGDVTKVSWGVKLPCTKKVYRSFLCLFLLFWTMLIDKKIAWCACILMWFSFPAWRIYLRLLTPWEKHEDFGLPGTLYIYAVCVHVWEFFVMMKKYVDTHAKDGQCRGYLKPVLKCGRITANDHGFFC